MVFGIDTVQVSTLYLQRVSTVSILDRGARTCYLTVYSRSSFTKLIPEEISFTKLILSRRRRAHRCQLSARLKRLQAADIVTVEARIVYSERRVNVSTAVHTKPIVKQASLGLRLMLLNSPFFLIFIYIHHTPPTSRGRSTTLAARVWTFSNRGQKEIHRALVSLAISSSQPGLAIASLLLVIVQ